MRLISPTSVGFQGGTAEIETQPGAFWRNSREFSVLKLSLGITEYFDSKPVIAAAVLMYYASPSTQRNPGLNSVEDI
jgi:hypothetical protein